jgi:hypothetical protein
MVMEKTFSERLNEAIAREKRTGIEFCTTCANEMDFSSSLHIDNPARYKNGAYYVEGGGQTCAFCARDEANAKDSK